MSLKFDVVSDLHVDAWFHETRLHSPNIRMWEGEPHKSEFLHVDWRWYKNEGSKVLIIAGDTANDVVVTAQVAACASREYEHVIIVDGNHEHYTEDSSVSTNITILKMQLARYPNITYLEGHNHVVIDGVMFAGATGWYDWKAFEDKLIHQSTAYRAWVQYSNDSRIPNYGELGDPAKLAILHSTQISEVVRLGTVDDAVEDIVVVTHMSPRADIMEWRENNPTWNALTPSYVNSSLARVLEADANKKIKCWVYGHTHFRKRTEIDGILYINNACGYPRENGPMVLEQVTIGE